MSPRISIRLLAVQSDERLVELARQGHERAFEALVERYRRPLLSYGRRLLGSDARAEDVLQQSLLAAWLALERGADVRDPRPWLYRIVHNAALNAMRAGDRDQRRLAAAAPDRPTLEPDLGRGIAVRETLAEVAALPAMQRDAILLTAVRGDSHEQVASALGVSHGAVRGLLYRARTTLRDAAAALIPQPLVNWAAGGAGKATPLADRVAELSSAGGGLGVSGMLLKGAVLSVSVGALAAGGAIVPSHHHGPPRSSRHGAGAGRSTGLAELGSAADRRSAAATLLAGVPQHTGVAERAAGRAGDRARRPGGGHRGDRGVSLSPGPVTSLSAPAAGSQGSAGQGLTGSGTGAGDGTGGGHQQGGRQPSGAAGPGNSSGGRPDSGGGLGSDSSSGSGGHGSDSNSAAGGRGDGSSQGSTSQSDGHQSGDVGATSATAQFPSPGDSPPAVAPPDQASTGGDSHGLAGSGATDGHSGSGSQDSSSADQSGSVDSGGDSGSVSGGSGSGGD
jgi:RNA polymerase sigma factor (sigma-70 family)